MESDAKQRLSAVAELIRRRNAIDDQIAALIGRPAKKGHIGEYLAGALFDIELERSATNGGFDGRFRGGALAGRSVNIKWYAKREGLLDINPELLPDFFLVLAGPKAAAAASRGGSRPWLVREVFLFEAEPLVERLRARSVRIGIATSVVQAEWETARLYPGNGNARLPVSEDAREVLALLTGV